MIQSGENKNAKIILWDIETTNLSANFGYVLCVSWKVLGEDKVHTVKITDSPTFKSDPTNDKYVVQKAAEELSKADIWVTWYGSKFDVPFLQTRLIKHGLPIMPDIANVDGWRTAKYRMKVSSNRLNTVSEFLGVEEKTPVRGDVWIKAMSGHAPSIRYVVEHCEQDVIVLEQVYEVILPLIKQHPKVFAAGGNFTDGRPLCSHCGDKRMIKRGERRTTTGYRSEYQCKNCGCYTSTKINKFV